MHSERSYTAGEVGFLLQEPLRAVKKALDVGALAYHVEKVSGQKVRKVAWRDVVFWHTYRTLKNDISPRARDAMHRAIVSSSGNDLKVVRFGRISIDVADIIQDLLDRRNAMEGLGEGIVINGDGLPALRESGLEVHRIAALSAGGMTVADILADFPNLSQADVDLALSYSEVYPKVGRPFPALTAKRAMQAAGLEALDEVLDECSE